MIGKSLSRQFLRGRLERLTGLFGGLKVARSQLGGMRFAAFALSKICAKILDPHLVPSYSQFGEDRIIEAFFSDLEGGFYVDVGCNHPISYSNTWKLYLRGWRGMAIDPNRELMRRYAKCRPGDIAVCKAVSNRHGCVDFYFSRASHRISGIGAKTGGRWTRTVDNADIVRCPAAPLSEILREYKVPERFELLNVDVEGHELAVMESLDFSAYRPGLIVVEMHGFDLSQTEQDPVCVLLKARGYALKAYFDPAGFFAEDAAPCPSNVC